MTYVTSFALQLLRGMSVARRTEWNGYAEKVKAKKLKGGGAPEAGGFHPKPPRIRLPYAIRSQASLPSQPTSSLA